ncbi:MAG: DUF167 domain-containing protein [Methanobacterium sp.]|nr:DUF167 domain-containing protein [Methanobacterium sp.]
MIFSDAITHTKNGILLEIDVSPKFDCFKISGYNEWRKTLEVKIKSVPQKGKANKEIVNEFSKITQHHVEILSGHKSHHKTLKIYDIDKNELLELLKYYF